MAVAVGVGFATMAANVWLTRKTVRQFTSGGRTALVGLYLSNDDLFVVYVFLHVLALNVIGLVVGAFPWRSWFAIVVDDQRRDE